VRDRESLIGCGKIYDEYQLVDGHWLFSSRRSSRREADPECVAGPLTAPWRRGSCGEVALHIFAHQQPFLLQLAAARAIALT
jgi:hypothetical protein